MKTIFSLLISVLVVSFSPSLSDRATIIDALKNKWIECVVIANDSFNAGQQSLFIENLNQLKSVITPSGTRFNSEVSDEQDFMNVNIELIVLNGKSVEITIDGFCIQKHNSYPTEGLFFTQHKESNEKLVKTVQLMNQKGISTNNTDATNELSETREILSEVTKIEGLISYEVKEIGSLKMEVCKSDGEVIRTLASLTPVQHLGDYRFNFNLKVQGWEKGLYSIRLKINNKVIHEQEFEVG